MELKERLKSIQSIFGEDDKRFAARLGLNINTWRAAKYGRQIGYEVIKASVQSFPDNEALHRDVIEYLKAAERENPKEKVA